MSEHHLLLQAGPRQLEALSRRDFLWRPLSDESSMRTTIGPRLEELGPVSDQYVDFVRLAALVYLVDRTTPRNRGFERVLDLTIPVFDPETWSAHSGALSEHLASIAARSMPKAFWRT